MTPPPRGLNTAASALAADPSGRTAPVDAGAPVAQPSGSSRDRLPLAILAAAMVTAAAILLYLGRGTVYTADELAWVIQSPGLDLRDAFTPHNGHLLLSTRLIYKVILEVFGSGYLGFRILTVALTLLSCGLLYVYVRRRVGPWVALAPSLVLLVFGSDSLHVMLGNGITIQLALACGVGALLALDRDDLLGDVIATVLLVLGCATYTIALSFVVGAAILVLLRADRWRRIWIPAVPLILYVAWWIWALGTSSDAEGQLVYSNVLTMPAWSLQALGAGVSALTGTNYSFTGNTGSGARIVAVPLGLIALAWLAWRAWRRPHAGVWVAVGIALTLWAIQSLARTPFGTPEIPRYLLPSAFVTVLLAAEAGRHTRWPRPALVAIFAVAAVGVMTNIALLRDNGAEQRVLIAPPLRADLSGLEIAGEETRPGFDNHRVFAGQNSLLFPFAEARVLRPDPALAYVQAEERYGRIGYSPQELASQGDGLRVQTDGVLAEALGVRLEPVAAAPRRGCRRLHAQANGLTFLADPPGALVVADGGEPVPIGLRRFSQSLTAPLGIVAAGHTAFLRVPPDRAPGRWHAATSASALTLCPPS